MPETIITKTCSKCKIIKPISEFYQRKTSKDGYISSCKQCVLTSTKQYSQTAKGKKSHEQAHKRYYKTKKGKATKRRYSQSAKAKAYWKRNLKIWRMTHHDRALAGCAVSNAIRRDVLAPAKTLICSCGQPANEYHHGSYAREDRLKVIPLCYVCHKAIHSTQTRLTS